MCNILNTCDHGHETHGEVRVLPLGSTEYSSNLIVCRHHYGVEMAWRRERNKTLGESAKFELPKWADLKIYTDE